jgi:hypothetical protein
LQVSPTIFKSEEFIKAVSSDRSEKLRALGAQSDLLVEEAKKLLQGEFLKQCVLSACVRLATIFTAEKDVLRDAIVDDPLSNVAANNNRPVLEDGPCDLNLSKQIFEQLKESLCLGIPTQAIVRMDDSFVAMRAGGEVHSPPSSGGMHAMNLVAITDGASGLRLIFRNSWGEDSIAVLSAAQACRIYAAPRYLSAEEAKVVNASLTEKKNWMNQVQDKWKHLEYRLQAEPTAAEKATSGH